MIRGGLIAAMLAALLLSAPTVRAHRYHVTVAEADFNAETGRLEVAVRVDPRDLERALRLADGDRPAPSTEEDRDARVASYLRATWLFIDADADTQSVAWVGAEYGARDAWLYFEVPLPGGLDGALMGNGMFLELEKDQVNTVNFRAGETAFTASFSRGEPVLTLALPREADPERGLRGP